MNDVQEYAKLVADPAVMQYIGNGLPQTYGDAESYVKKCIANIDLKGWSRFVVVNKHTNDFMGFCGFSDYNNELDFGWRYAKRFWGKGYGTEAAKAVLNLGLTKFHFPRIVSIAYPENIGSIRIIEKIGMTFEKKILLNSKDVLQYIWQNHTI